ncbi:MAG: hypothetical protein R2867_06790 [Caldilineaceae bacterium]
MGALSGKLHPLGTIPGFLPLWRTVGGSTDKMQRTVQVPNSLVVVLNGLVVLFVVASELYADVAVSAVLIVSDVIIAGG